VGDPNKTIIVHTNATLDLWNLTAANVNKLITLRDGATIFSENGHSTIDGAITLESGTATFNVNNGGTAPALIVNNTISGPGSLLKIGAAPLTLVTANTYTGATVVSNGTLYVDGSIGGAGVSVYGGTLAGMGTLSAPVTVYPNGTLSPAGTGTNGTLTISGALNLQGLCILDVNKASGVFTGDLIANVTALTFGGTLQLNLTGDALAVGDVIPLYTFTSASGGFSAISPASPGPGLVWDTHTLAVDGKLRVAVPSNPPSIGNIHVSGSSVSISGSGGTAGATYYVLSSTNVALPPASWTPVATNQFDNAGNFTFSQTIDPGTPARFYRIQLP
jgi:autotransporter-associated beta strand protein